jgi:8-oxo-dGTP diphosphatase
VAAVTSTPVRAAGGVVWRPRDRGGVELCLVHRPRYDDWSLPKGKLHAGEHPLIGAVREVAEETAVTAVPQVRLPTINYRLATGVPKSVEYWTMRARSQDPFTPNDEVDAVRWVPAAEAAGLLSYDHDADLVRHALTLPAVTAVVVLLRHGYAGERGEWDGPDAVRPLDERGRTQAEALVDLVALFAPERLVSATPDRCRQTLLPAASLLDLPVAADPAYDETSESAVAVAALRELAGTVESAVVVSQGKLIPRALGLLRDEPADRYATPKGEGWLIAFAGDKVAGIDALPL